MLQENEKYLYVSYNAGGGLDSKIYDLEIIINTALSMRRIPIIDKLQLAGQHFIRLKHGTKVNWEQYINLPKTKVFKVAHGEIKELSGNLQYIYKQDFDFSSYPKNQIRYIDRKQLYDKENEQYPIICLLKNKDMPTSSERPLEEQGYNTRMNHCYDGSFFIVFPPSQEVNDLTDIVLNHFGTTRESMNTMGNIIYRIPRVRNGTMQRFSNAGCYACMHVRYGRCHRRASRLIKQSKDLRRKICKLCKNIYKRQHKSLPIYIMTNIKEVDYFDFLKPRFNVYRYTDFKELKARFTGEGFIDNYLLYSVEKNLMQHALVKIFPYKRNRFIYEAVKTGKNA